MSSPKKKKKKKREREKKTNQKPLAITTSLVQTIKINEMNNFILQEDRFSKDIYQYQVLYSFLLLSENLNTGLWIILLDTL